jgi:DNA-nicking Smr family endonuclease
VSDDPVRVPDDETAPVRLPIEAELDLHAFAPRDVSSVVEEYLTEAARAGFREVRVVHGRGRGVQRGIVQAALDRHPCVEEFRDDTSSHLGATWVRLRAQSSCGPSGPP